MAKLPLSDLFNEAAKAQPSGKITLVEVDVSQFMPLSISHSHGDGVLRFHYAPIPHTPNEIIAANGDTSRLAPKSIWFGGKQFDLWPFEFTDVSMTTEQQQAATLTVSNIDGVISALCAFNQGGYRGDDLVNAKVNIIQTYTRFLDGRNFAGNFNPDEDPTQAYIQTCYISRRAYSSGDVVRFELSSPLDLQGMNLPTRQITRYCTWQARGWYKKGAGYGCTYDPARYGNRMFDDKGNPVNDPSKDKCGGCLRDCKIRFGENAALDFGGEPAVQIYRS